MEQHTYITFAFRRYIK